MVNEDNLILESKEISEQSAMDSSIENVAAKKPSGKEEDLGLKNFMKKVCRMSSLGKL
jgi:hypothetical protein